MDTWDLKKSDDLSWVKMKYGTEFNKTQCVMGCEYIFPNCDDPMLVLAACGDYRFDWDRGLEAFDEIKQYANRNT